MGNGVKDFQALLGGTSDAVADRVVCDNYISQEEGLSEEERERCVKDYLSLHCEMEKCLYLTGATMLKCTEGSKGVVFEPTDHNVNFNGEMAIAATDCKVGEHIKCFGVCFGQSNPEVGAVLCNPKIAHNKWLESCSRMKVGDADSVNENSYLICVRAEGGRIYPVIGNGITDEGPDIEEQIQELMEQIKGEEIISYKYEDMVKLPTVEILARMIYQEDHSFDQGRQNAIVFSVVNRLWAGDCSLTDKLGEKKNNNLYGIVTAGNQYNSIFKNEDAKDSSEEGKYNAYRPPTEQNAPESEKEAWENAKRLAAITYLAVEMYGKGEETERGKCVVSQDNNVRESIIDFMESQVDSQGNEIENNIGYYQSFRGANNEIDAEDYRKEGKIAFEDEKGKAVGNVFRKK